MSLKKIALTAIAALCLQFAMAQVSIVKGRLVGSSSKQPLTNVTVTVPTAKLVTISREEGRFVISNIPYGTYDVVISGDGFTDKTVSITVNGPVTDMGDIEVDPGGPTNGSQEDKLPAISLEEISQDASGEGGSSQNVSGVLTASRDAFVSATQFTFSSMRFRPRGYDNDQTQVYLNGIPVNDLDNGGAVWGQWGGLNDVFRGRATTYGLGHNEYGFGGLGLTTSLDASASNQRKQTRVSYAISNRSYNHRVMFTHSTGLSKKGWAFTISGSRRWANEGYVAGTFYDAYSYFGAIEKVFKKHSLSLIAFGAPTKRGAAGPAIQEAYDLAGTNFYNPYWGYQNGKKRNARVRDSHQPQFIFTYEFRPNSNTLWQTSVGYQFGKNGYSNLDWFNSADPRPDYYRKLPSFQDSANLGQLVADYIKANPSVLQINWNNLYQSNYLNHETLNDANGIPGNTVSGKWARYLISEDHEDTKRFNLNSVVQTAVSETVNFYAGINIQSQTIDFYRQVKDLLGADFFVNLNQFAERDFPGNANALQYDLNHPNRVVHVGDRYGFDYTVNYNKASGWMQTTVTGTKVDFFFTGGISFTGFQRVGHYKHGLFPTSSYGASDKLRFANFNFKTGFTYKINGRNFLFANAAYLTQAPYFENVFLSPRTRNDYVSGVKSEEITSLEGGYLLRAPNVKARLVGYVTQIKNAVDNRTFYHDDLRTFVNYSISGINKRYMGVEAAVDVKVTPSLSAVAVASMGKFTYLDRANGIITQDNNNTVAQSELIYWKNYYLSAGPQKAYTLGLNYRSKKFWFLNVNANYYTDNWLDINPARRTAAAVDLVVKDSKLWHDILDQQKAKDAFTVDIFGGKSWRLKDLVKSAPSGYFLYLNVGVNNVLNDKNIVVSGFEQLRYNFNERDPNSFPSKYFYGFGINFFASAALRF